MWDGVFVLPFFHPMQGLPASRLLGARNSFIRHGCLHGGMFLDILKFERGYRPQCTFQKSKIIKPNQWAVSASHECYSNLLFSSQLMLSWCWVLVLIVLMSKSVIIGLLHSCNWLKSWMFVHLLEFYSRFNIWCTWISSEYFKSLYAKHQLSITWR